MGREITVGDWNKDGQDAEGELSTKGTKEHEGQEEVSHGGRGDGFRVSIGLPQDKVAAYCRRWEISELALFGSVLRDDFGPDSDVDVLVRFDPVARHGLSEWMEMERELVEILGRDVDLISRQAVEGSDNYIRRKAILGSAQVIYAA